MTDTTDLRRFRLLLTKKPLRFAMKGLAFAHAKSNVRHQDKPLDVVAETQVGTRWKETDRWRFFPTGDVELIRARGSLVR